MTLLNGSTWVTVPGGSVSGNNKVWKKFTFAPITTTKIRVYITATSDNWSRIVEVEAWSTSPGANINWLVSDHLGTPRMIIDQSGTLANVRRHDYLPFGEELFAPAGGRNTTLGYATGDGLRQQFTAKERDVETGLDYFLARYYSSTQGRFISADTFAGSPYDPQSLNRYAYVLNNPLALIDPDGHVAQHHQGGCPKYRGGCLYKGQDPDPKVIKTPMVPEGDPKFDWSTHILDGPIVVRDPGGPITPITTTDPVLATLPPSILDIIPAVAPSRQFLFDFTTHDFEHALFSFGLIVADLTRFRGVSKTGGKFASIGMIPAAPSKIAPAAQALVTVNRTVGNAWRNELAALFERAGYTVQTEVMKRTPFGRRFIDIEVSLNGRVLGGIEAKAGNAVYNASQRAKDWYLRKWRDYVVTVARDQ